MPCQKVSFVIFQITLLLTLLVYFNFKQHQISPAAYLPDWLIPLFLNHLDLSTCAHLWDVLLLEGDSFLYRAALAVLAVLEPRLFFPDRTELLELLKYVLTFGSRLVEPLLIISCTEAKTRLRWRLRNVNMCQLMGLNTTFMVSARRLYGRKSTAWKSGGKTVRGHG